MQSEQFFLKHYQVMAGYIPKQDVTSILFSKMTCSF